MLKINIDWCTYQLKVITEKYAIIIVNTNMLEIYLYC